MLLGRKTVAEFASEHEVSPQLVNRKIRRLGIELQRDPLDRRRRLMPWPNSTEYTAIVVACCGDRVAINADVELLLSGV
jgi:hypothetical protein